MFVNFLAGLGNVCVYGFSAAIAMAEAHMLHSVLSDCVAAPRLAAVTIVAYHVCEGTQPNLLLTPLILCTVFFCLTFMGWAPGSPGLSSIQGHCLSFLQLCSCVSGCCVPCYQTAV